MSAPSNDNRDPARAPQLVQILGEISADNFKPAGEAVELAVITPEPLQLYRPAWRRDSQG